MENMICNGGGKEGSRRKINSLTVLNPDHWGDIVPNVDTKPRLLKRVF